MTVAMLIARMSKILLLIVLKLVTEIVKVFGFAVPDSMVYWKKRQKEVGFSARSH